MSNQDVIFEIGQVWALASATGYTYEVYEIVHAYDGRYTIWTRNYFNGEFIRNGNFFSEPGCSARHLSDDWYLVKGRKTSKKFTRISPRTLQKRMRDQVAAEVLNQTE